MRKKLIAAGAAALMAASGMGVATADRADAASILVFSGGCSGTTRGSVPGDYVLTAKVLRFERTPGTTDHIYIDVKANDQFRIFNVRMNGRAANFRYIYPAPPGATNGSDAPNLARRDVRPTVSVTWQDRFGRKPIYTCDVPLVGRR